MILMEQLEQELLETDEYVCVNPDIGRDLLDFLDNQLSPPQRRRFETHLRFCLKCQDDLAYLQSILNALKCRSAATNAAPRIPVTRFADEIALEMAWMPLAQTAAGSKEEHTFQVDDGRIEMTYEWESPKADEPGYVVISWQAEIDSARELTIQFFQPDTHVIFYEEEIGTIRQSHATFTFDELGFDPEHEKWAIAIG